jgi:glycosyltransferase involved in cell wall biosynthesis
MVMSIDIVILTKNESKNLPDCLASCQDLGQIIVIDDHSTDDTVQLAQAAGAVVHSRVLDDFSQQRNFAVEVSKSDWLFFLDADERLSPDLIEAIKLHMEGPKTAGRVLRKNFAFGRRFRFGHLSPDWVTRLFPQGQVKWIGQVHERPETNLPIKELKGHMVHLTYRDWDHFLAKMERYSRIWAFEAAKNGKKCGLSGALVKAWANLFKTLILKFGILEGPYGWAVSAVSGYYTLSKYLMLSDLEKSITSQKKSSD